MVITRLLIPPKISDIFKKIIRNISPLFSIFVLNLYKTKSEL